MPNPFFSFKEFTVYQDRCTMKVTTDACLFGAWCAEELKNSDVKKALDIGAGTGLLSLMVAQKTDIAITAIDIDSDAVEQAKDNFYKSLWNKKIQAKCVDAIEFTSREKFDVIISNPPFYENEVEPADSKKKIAHHGQGLKLEDLLAVIKTNLTDDGIFFLLLPYKRHRQINEAMKKAQLFVYKQVVVAPTAAHQPSRLMIKGGRHAEAILVNEMAITDSERNYTDEFKFLLKDYYLH